MYEGVEEVEIANQCQGFHDLSSPNLVFDHKELEGHHTILLYLHEFQIMVMCNFFPLSRNTLITLKHNRVLL